MDPPDSTITRYTPLATEAMYHPDQLFFEALVAGESTACFDGQYFFDTDHAWKVLVAFGRAVSASRSHRAVKLSARI